MKKTTLAIAFGMFAFAASAQKSQIRAANNYLADGDLEKAKAAIETAVNDNDTKGSASAWYTRGIIYLKMQQQPANDGKMLYDEAGTSLKKAIELDPKFEKDNMNSNLFAVAIFNFNDGLKAFDKQQYTESYDRFKNVVELSNLENGKRFASFKKMDTISRQAALYEGYSAYYANRFDDAMPLLAAAKNDPVVKDPNIYLMLADIYSSKNDKANTLTTFSEAKTAYPTNKAVANAEINYYLRNSDPQEVIKKINDAIATEPNNPDLLFNLAGTYDKMANPKDAKNNDLPKPANYEELFASADEAYKNALKVAPEKADINYNLGALYYNRAIQINEEMNAITGTTSTEIKKYDALKVKREAWFDKALPYLEKTFNMLDAQGFAKLNNDDKVTYQSSLIAMKEIYAKQNKFDKVAELKAKLEATRN